jgi:hypothetical protein
LSTVDTMTATPASEPERTRAGRTAIARVRRIKLASWLAPTSNAAVYAGLALIVIGFAVLAWTWSRVAGKAIVALQLPYLASGGFSGLGLLVIGTLLIYLGVKRRDSWNRERRLEALATALRAAGAGEPAPEEDEALD